MAIADYMKEQFVTEAELMVILGCSPERIRDLRSHHINGKQNFIDHFKPAKSCILYLTEDVKKFLEREKFSFGIALENSGQEVSD